MEKCWVELEGGELLGSDSQAEGCGEGTEVTWRLEGDQQPSHDSGVCICPNSKGSSLSQGKVL